MGEQQVFELAPAGWQPLRVFEIAVIERQDKVTQVKVRDLRARCLGAADRYFDELFVPRTGARATGEGEDLLSHCPSLTRESTEAHRDFLVSDIRPQCSPCPLWFVGFKLDRTAGIPLLQRRSW